MPSIFPIICFRDGVKIGKSEEGVGDFKKKLKKYLTIFVRGGIELKKFNIIVLIFTKPMGKGGDEKSKRQPDL